MRELRRRGWSYVLRLRTQVWGCTDSAGGKLRDLGLRPGDGPRCRRRPSARPVSVGAGAVAGRR